MYPPHVVNTCKDITGKNRKTIFNLVCELSLAESLHHFEYCDFSIAANKCILQVFIASK